MSMEFIAKVKKFFCQKAGGDIQVLYNSNLKNFVLSHLISGSFIISLTSWLQRKCTKCTSKNMHKSVPNKVSIMIVLNFKVYPIVISNNLNIRFFSNSGLTVYHTCRICLQMMKLWPLRSLGPSSVRHALPRGERGGRRRPRDQRLIVVNYLE